MGPEEVTAASPPAERFPWSPEQVTTPGELGAVLRDMRARSGLGYKAFEVKARRLVEAGKVGTELGHLATNPLPNSSLHRAIETYQVRWFAAAPGRLEVFLRVAGCPEAKLARWLERLAELADVDDSASGPPPVAAGAGRPPAPRPGRRRRIVTVAVAIAFVIFLIVLASHARFYAALGLNLGELPLSLGGLVAATFVVTLLVAAAGVLVVGAFAAGAALVPWVVPTRAATPAAALPIVVGVGGYVGWTALPVPGAEFAVAALGMVVCGCQFRLLTRQRPATWLTGWAVGLAATATISAAAVTVGRWSGSTLWLLAALVAGTATAALALHRWLRWELRRDGLAERAHTTPAVVLAQLHAELVPSVGSVLRPRMTSGQARRFVAATALLTIVAAVLVVGVVAYLIGTAAEAGRAAREYGYVPSGHGSLVWSAPVRPARITPTQADRDPLRLCQRPYAWSASLIAHDGNASWVLLRPRLPGGESAQVARLSTRVYTVRPVLDPEIPEGEPWTGAACTR